MVWPFSDEVSASAAPQLNMHYFTTDCTHGITMSKTSQRTLRLNNESGQAWGKRRFNDVRLGKYWFAMMQLRYKLNFLNEVYRRNSYFDSSYPHINPLPAAIVTVHLVLLEIQTFCRSHLRNIFEILQNLTKNAGTEGANAHFRARVQGLALALWHSTVSENQFWPQPFFFLNRFQVELGGYYTKEVQEELLLQVRK